MRVLARNKQDIWYSNPTGNETYVTDDNGLKSGEKEHEYGDPVKCRMSMAISSGANNLGSQGMATLDPQGISTAYTHKAITEDKTCDMGEESRVWYGIEPTKIVQKTVVINEQVVIIEETVNVPHNFKVVRKAKSLNHLIFYLKEVDVS